MFKQVKSALFWYYLYKFRRRVILITLLLLIALFANSIYSDVVQYLQLQNELKYLKYVLILKWIIILSSVLLSVYLILTIFKKQKQEEEKEKKSSKPTKKQNNNKKIIKEKVDKTLSSREEKFLYKKELKSKADSLLDR